MAIKVREFIRTHLFKQVSFDHVFMRVERPAWKHKEETRYVSTWEPVKMTKRVGWVVGLRWLQTGFRVPGSSYASPSNDYDDYDPPTFKETDKRKPCVLVMTWPTRKPERVPFDAIEILDEEVPVYSMDASERNLMALQSRDWPRDELGRFTPEPMPMTETAQQVNKHLEGKENRGGTE
jgi:hypothetical protein